MRFLRKSTEKKQLQKDVNALSGSSCAEQKFETYREQKSKETQAEKENSHIYVIEQQRIGETAQAATWSVSEENSSSNAFGARRVH